MNRRNVEMFSGDSVLLEITVRLKNGQLADVSGAALTYAAALTPKDTTVLMKTVGDGITVTGLGTVQVRFEPEDTSDLPSDNYYHELRAVSSAGSVTTLMFGTLTVNDNLT